MPTGDGTGPQGEGPMTGRRLGYCAGYSTPGFMNQGFGRGGFGRGRGRGFGRGRGWRWRQSATQVVPVQQVQQTPLNEKQALENEKKAIEEEKKYLEEEFNEVIKRLKELKK